MSRWPNRVQCFFLEPTEQVEVYLRRYTDDGGECSYVGNYGYHQAKLALPGVYPDDEVWGVGRTVTAEPSKCPIQFDDPRWPVQCHCGFKFQDDVIRQFVTNGLWRTPDGTLVTLRNAAPGAMWYATWLEDVKDWCGPDGKCLIVKLPNGSDWMIDSTASNCTLPGERTHRCWVRHGVPPNITVDKNGHTCGAGAGSIMSGEGEKNYHGFLRNGWLEEC